MKMSKNRTKWAISLVSVLAVYTSLHARREQWQYLGDSHVDGHRPRQHKGWSVGWNYRAIQLRLRGGAINSSA